MVLTQLVAIEVVRCLGKPSDRTFAVLLVKLLDGLQYESSNYNARLSCCISCFDQFLESNEKLIIRRLNMH